MYNEDLTGDLIAMNLTGKSKINLVDETIDYDLEVMVPQGQRTEELGLGRAAGRYVPIKVSGSLDDPSVKADVGALIGDKVKSLIRDQLGIGREPAPAPDQAAPAEGETPPAEEPKSTQDQLKEEAAKKLKKLFGG